MADPMQMADPGKAFKNNPFRKITLDIVHHGVGPLYGHVGEAGDGNDFARAHYEQHMRVEGTLDVEGEGRIVINGHGAVPVALVTHFDPVATGSLVQGFDPRRAFSRATSP